MKMPNRYSYFVTLLLILFGCQQNKKKAQFQEQLEAINLTRGDIALCGPEEEQFGEVEFSLSCSEKVRADFNLATALLHSFEYREAEKIFAKVIDEDQGCVMAYWGVAMSNFHPLWGVPTAEELKKGAGAIRLARSLKKQSKKESDFLEAVAAIYDDWDKIDYQARILKFEKAAAQIYQRYPDDKEAAIFYALALRAASDPKDKTFHRQRKAGRILSNLFATSPDHPGIAHYLIHTFDYPELAEMGLPAARKYASIAASSAHALHMPSHIFTRLGLWDESIQSNRNSVSAAKCYAENSGMNGHWDEEVHGIDYLVYAYLQQGRDKSAKEQLEYIRTMKTFFPINNKHAYTLAAVPVRYALERKKWHEALELKLQPANFPWENFPWESSIVSFGRVIGAVHMHDAEAARSALQELQANHAKLSEQKRDYEAQQVQIQILASEAWIHFSQGNKDEALRLMTVAAMLEDATDKHPVTPGEVVPARELLGDMYFEMGDFGKALEAYEADLERHPGRFNALYGAGLAAKNAGQFEKAGRYFHVLMESADSTEQRAELKDVELYLESRL